MLVFPNWHDDVIKWKHFPRYWPFVRWIHRSPVNSPHKGKWRGALMFSLICAGTNGWDAGDFRRHRSHYDVIVMNLTFETETELQLDNGSSSPIDTETEPFVVEDRTSWNIYTRLRQCCVLLWNDSGRLQSYFQYFTNVPCSPTGYGQISYIL